MFKKLLIASVALSVASSAFAGYKGEVYKGEEQAAPAPCASLVLTAPYVGISVGPRINTSGAPNNYEGVEGTLFAGYGAGLGSNFYLGGELFVQDSAKNKEHTDEGVDGVRTKWGFGASIIPGYLVTDHVLAYIRGGVVRTRFSDAGENKTGWQAGLGAETNLYENWDGRGEWVYSHYNNVEDAGKPHSQQVNVGLVYKFV